MRARRDLDRIAVATAHNQRVVIGIQLCARRLEMGKHDLKIGKWKSCNFHIATGHHRASKPCDRFHVVWNDFVLGAMQTLNTSDLDMLLTEHSDLCTHATQQGNKVQNFRTDMRVPDTGDAVRQCRTDNRVLGRSGRAHRQMDIRTNQAALGGLGT